MDEGEIKICENCKREIPAVNFTIHAVHCLRNIRICNVCKEPVPNAELQQHQDKMHTLLPCRQCGERVRGADLDDHVRDSCAHTMKCCKFCQLELRRGALPAHERYCGARTELCECGEWVMHKYSALHLDSNHGFVRLHDDPEPVNGDLVANVPKPAKTKIKPYKPESLSFLNNVNNTNRSIAYNGALAAARSSAAEPAGSTANSHIRNAVSNTSPANATAGSSGASGAGSSGASGAGSSGAAAAGSGGPAVAGSSGTSSSSAQNCAILRAKRINERPQVNVAAASPDKVQKNLWAMRGAVKKRAAPKPPGSPPGGPREPALRCALQRRQQEEEQRREQSARNLAAGRPPVLSAADRLDRLRALDELFHPDADRRCRHRATANQPSSSAARNSEGQRPKNDLRNLKPMTPQEFMERFNELQLMQEPREEPVRNADRFSQIKSSLRELRRGLNEVTAPYCAGASADANHNAGPGDERLPCEFCGELLPADDLVMHETGCRPDLAQYWPPGAPLYAPAVPAASLPSPRASPPAPTPPASPRASPPASPPASPFIPCEFCTAPLPVYLVSEHQERCGRDAELLFQD